ncbi:glycosyltransferase [Xenorhabdus anantnagensis]|uniref:Glycosyltransferase n=1 Tax=Xenorhabdus anantnagensis TaxID=3025875 RepID=A0ABT5LQ34_9GAMM|nr:glycosyltransferase [Xenorhabdus anantnagensis]MDC9596369.1 glycosyltransferase [Xenorhabdus anantnagensis]
MKNLSSGNKKMIIAIVINEKYISNHYTDGFKVGATSFTLKMVNYFIKQQVFAGFILYKRDESLLAPKIEQLEINEIKYIKIFFNFSMNSEDIREALAKGLSFLSINNNQKYNIFAYYQTDTLLSYHPSNIPCAVTHHGPFVEDFQRNYSQEGAYQAFENKDKAIHLYKQQSIGIITLIDKGYFVIQHSKLQGDYLVSKGVHREKIKQVNPPMFSCENHECSSLNSNISNFLNTNKDEILLFTAVARLDYFKNIELLINSSISLLEKGIPTKILILGDEEKHDHRRDILNFMIPVEYRKYFLISHKLSHTELFIIFNEIKKKAIFVCTSRYETLGITPLEAALNGIYTIVPNLSSVEASAYFSSEDKFNYDIASLTKKIISICDKNLFISDTQQQKLRTLLSKDIFEESVNKIYNEISEGYRLPLISAI